MATTLSTRRVAGAHRIRRDQPSAVACQPSVSTPAALSAPGWLEVEAGFLHEQGAAPRRAW